MPHMKPQTHKQKITATEKLPTLKRSVEKKKCEGCGVRGWGSNQFYLRETSFYFDAAPNYKYMFGQYMGPLPHLWNTQWNTYTQNTQ